MRKIIIVVAFATLAMLVFGVSSFAQAPITVTINGDAVSFEAQTPIIDSGHTLVPLRGVFEALGFDVEWDQALTLVTLSRDGDIALVQIGSYSFTVNGHDLPLTTPARIIGGSTMLPIRALLESLGYSVEWEHDSRTVAVTSQDPQHGLQPTTDIVGERFVIPNERPTHAQFEEWVLYYTTHAAMSAFEASVIADIQLVRKAHGLHSVEHDVGLILAARFYAQTMADLGTPIGHNEGPFAIADATHGASVEIARIFGNNLRWSGGLAAGGLFEHAQYLVDMWLEYPANMSFILSPEHRFVGFGTVYGGPMGAAHYLFLSDKPSEVVFSGIATPTGDR